MSAREKVQRKFGAGWARIRPLLILLAGVLLIWSLVHLANILFTNIVPLYQSTPVWESVNTAVRAVAIFFILIWGLFTLDRTFSKKNLKDKYALSSKTKPQFSRFFTHPFVHDDQAHVQSHLPRLLLFVGIAALIVSSAQPFLLATVIILLVEGMGVWVYGAKGSHLGASGLVLGYYAFIVGYGWLMWQFWITAVAILIAITFIKPTYHTLKNQDDSLSVAGHWFGLLGGFLAAYAIFQLT